MEDPAPAPPQPQELSLAAGPATQLDLVRDEDAEEIYALIDGDRARLAEWLPWAPSSTIEGTREFIRLSRERHAASAGLDLAIRHEGRIVGLIGLHDIDPVNLRTDLGYWIGAAAEGKGIATSSVKALCSYCFYGLGLHRIEIRVAPGNRRSRAIPERLGFQEDGILREYERVADRWLDQVVYSVLEKEWRMMRPPEDEENPLPYL